MIIFICVGAVRDSSGVEGSVEVIEVSEPQKTTPQL